MKDVVEKRAPKRFNHVAQALAADCLALVPSAGAGTTMTWSHSADTDAVASTRGSGVRALDKRALFRCPSLFALSSLSFFFFFFFLLFSRGRPVSVGEEREREHGTGEVETIRWHARETAEDAVLSLPLLPATALRFLSSHPIRSPPLAHPRPPSGAPLPACLPILTDDDRR